ncbi:hypothetical protein CVT26_001978 [Gymnopilus dilepis]|uniref:Uncharacterized protein n=1 Tax=Gymnopilus dilepis TaxID=231916 RepID=A0A409VEL5_9AGAR|nr:hypothetical protein CVT26_001978 [Gymnopilus dilepis]
MAKASCILSGPQVVLGEEHLAPCPTVEADELDDIILLGKEILSFFDTCPNMEDDKQVLYDTLPSRPGSSLEQYEECNVNMVPRSRSLVGHAFPARTMSLAHKVRRNHIDIKAAHNATIVILRVPRDIHFADLKERLYDKFVKQEQILLSRSFSVILALPPQPNPRLPKRNYRRMSLANCTEMRFIDIEADWRETVATNDGSKITLRILDTQP